ncbi:MAG: ATP-binding protein [Nitrosopumilaceae archaeon]|nr:ATP-binding protein [Nitrosopumilaceae archaeon]
MNRDLGSRIKKYRNHGVSTILQMAEGDIPEDVYALTVFLSKLNCHLDEYFVVGGMPIAVTAFKKLGIIPDSVYKTYLDAVTNDLKSIGSNMAYVEQMMPNIIKSVCSPVSWRSLSSDTDIGSHHTVAEYVMTLADAFVLNIVYRYDMTSDGPKYNGMKKIYFRDPLFLHAWNTTRRQESIFRSSLAYAEDTSIKSRIAEQTAAGHITRLAFSISRNKMMYNDQLSIFYWSSKNNNEIDFAVRNGDDIIPIEVKYKNRIRTDDMYGIIDMRKAGGASGGLVLTRNEIGRKGGNVLVPLAVFLALI